MIFNSVIASAGGGGGSDPYPVIGDGKTYLHIQVTDMLRPTVSIRFTQSASRGVTVDWGDGSAAETYTGTSAATHEHTYAAVGEYTIVLDVTSGYIRYGGGSSNSLFVTSSTANGVTINRSRLLAAEIGTHGVTTNTIGSNTFYYCYSLQSVTIPSGVTSIGANAFNYCYSLKSATIPSGVTSIGANAFDYCSSLQSVTIPEGVTSIGDYAFYYCYSLQSVTIPESVTSIGRSMFYNCYSLQSVTIPESVTSIGTSMFYNCCSIKEYHLQPTTPPTLAHTNAFTNISSDCIIYVPSGSLEAYKTATNWSTYASEIQGE